MKRCTSCGGLSKADDGDFVRDGADDGVENGVQVAVVANVVDADAAGLRDDHQSERLKVGIGLEMDFLGDAVVGDAEILEPSEKTASLLSCSRTRTGTRTSVDCEVRACEVWGGGS